MSRAPVDKKGTVQVRMRAGVTKADQLPGIEVRITRCGDELLCVGSKLERQDAARGEAGTEGENDR